MPMTERGKEAERQRLAEALRANLKRRKTVARPARAAPQDTPTGEADRPAPDGKRG